MTPEERRARNLVASRRYRKAHPEKFRAYKIAYNKAHPGQRRARHLITLYSITSSQYDLMLARQGGACAIRGCGNTPKTRRLHVDHDHKTGRVRGALCFHCNLYIVSRNTLESARAVVEYLSSDFDGRDIGKEQE